MMDWISVLQRDFLQVYEAIVPGLPHTALRVMKGHAVAALVYNPERDAVAFVRQQRWALMHFANDGYVVEVIAGHVGKAPPQHALWWELFEEAGIKAEREELESQMTLLNGGRNVTVSPGFCNERMWLMYVRLKSGQCDDSRTIFGKEEEGERTELLWVPAAQLEEMECEDLKTWGLVQWFLRQREKGNPLCLP